jgi:hypothetical protein
MANCLEMRRMDAANGKHFIYCISHHSTTSIDDTNGMPSGPVRWHTVVRTSHPNPSHPFVPFFTWDLGILYLRQRVISGCRGKRKKEEFRCHQPPVPEIYLSQVSSHYASIHRIYLRARLHNLNRTRFYIRSLGTRRTGSGKVGFPVRL